MSGNTAEPMNEDDEYNSLSTRRSTYIFKQEKQETSSASAKKTTRYQHSLKCVEHHNAKVWNKQNDDCPSCMVFEPAPLPNGKLPTLHAVICYHFYLRASSDYCQKSSKMDVTFMI